MSRFPQAPLTAEGISAMATVAREQGAARMRRLIRAKQREALEGVRLLLAKLDETPDLDAAIRFTGELDRSTRASRKGRAK